MFKILSTSEHSNEIVTNYYIDIIYKACLDTGLETSYITKKDNPLRNEYIIVATVIDALKYWLKGYRKIIIWVQGIHPEESYMKHSSRVRFIILSIIESYMLKKSKLLFVVSGQMNHHFKNKYGIDIESKSYVMPCFNTEFHPECFTSKNKYRNNIFSYIGSLTVWQCFEETINLYKKIEDKLERSELRVYTTSVNEAIKKIQNINIKNYSVEYVPNDELYQRLKDVSYGFVVRNDSIVNWVATPTKLSSYIACGVIPIFSNSLDNFHELSKGLKYKFALKKTNTDIEEIIEFCKKEVDIDEIKYEYDQVFNDYYNKSKHIKEITTFLSCLR